MSTEPTTPFTDAERELGKTDAAIDERLEKLSPHEQSREFIQIITGFDSPTWSRRFIKVRDHRGRLVPLVYNRTMRALHAMPSRRRFTLGPRQIGKTTYHVARIGEDVVKNELLARIGDPRARQVNSMLFLHKAEATEAQLERFDLIIDETPAGIRPQMKTDRKNLKVAKETGSRVFLQTAGGETPGQSFTTHRLVISEAANPIYDEALMAGVTQTVPQEDLGGLIEWESVPYGPEGYFYDGYNNADPRNRLFIPWWWGEVFRLGNPKDWSDVLPLWDDERDIVEHQAIRADQMRWWRAKVREMAPGDAGPGGLGEALARQQYPWDDLTCWYGAVGKPFIRPGLLREYIREAEAMEVMRAELIEDAEGRVQWIEKQAA